MSTSKLPAIIDAVHAGSSRLNEQLKELSSLKMRADSNLAKANLQFPRVVDYLDAVIDDILADITIDDRDGNILQSIGMTFLFKKNRQAILEESKNAVKQNNANLPTELNSIISRLSATIERVDEAKKIIAETKIFDIDTYLTDKDGIIEIVFDGKVAIEDFSDAKKQMEQWQLIIDGYAKALGVSKEDFQIISIVKASPTKFRIRTNLKNTALMLSIFVSLLNIQRGILDNLAMINNLRQSPVTSDEKLNNEFIKRASEELDARIEKEIAEVVEKKLKEQKIGKGNGDIKNSFAKGVQYQYNFINNGGTVNVYIANDSLQDEAKLLEKVQKEIQTAKNSSASIKQIENITTDDIINGVKDEKKENDIPESSD